VGKNVPTSREEDVRVRLQETDGIDEVIITDSLIFDSEKMPNDD
jgi:pyrimidine operon attenuation protein/uracil phosphoribosyltransferase